MSGYRFERHSGRVISAARIAFASLFLFAVWIDPSQPAQAAEATYLILAGYVLVAAVIAAVTWNSWWLDSRIAAPAHILDIAIFTALVVATAGYTSPFFVFFVFVLFAAAIRWDWTQTAITAAALIILYLSSGLLVALTTEGDFDLQRFIIRTGHLVILSGLIIWFGIHQAQILGSRPLSDVGPTQRNGALEKLLSDAARSCNAARAILIWRDGENDEAFLDYRSGRVRPLSAAAQEVRLPPGGDPFLYDVERDRALIHRSAKGPERTDASGLIDRGDIEALELSSGLAVPLTHSTGVGMLFLEQIATPSSDHLSFGAKLGRQMIGEIQRLELVRAVEESGESRARLAFARDLHDNVVQFLAGATFKIEAMIRRFRAAGTPQDDLAELKQLMLQEQKDLRIFIETLRTGDSIGSDAMDSSLFALCQRMADQWSIDCRMQSEIPAMTVPMRIYLDTQQLVREAVANAVRHGQASEVAISIALDERILRLKIDDNGRGLSSGRSDPPWSLSGRVSSAGGRMDIESSDNGTAIAIDLPLRKMRI